VHDVAACGFQTVIVARVEAWRKPKTRKCMGRATDRSTYFSDVFFYFFYITHMCTDKVCFFFFESFKSPTQIAYYAHFIGAEKPQTQHDTNVPPKCLLYITILYIGILSYRFTEIVSLLFPFAKALLRKQPLDVNSQL